MFSSIRWAPRWRSTKKYIPPVLHMERITTRSLGDGLRRTAKSGIGPHRQFAAVQRCACNRGKCRSPRLLTSTVCVSILLFVDGEFTYYLECNAPLTQPVGRKLRHWPVGGSRYAVVHHGGNWGFLDRSVRQADYDCGWLCSRTDWPSYCVHEISQGESDYGKSATRHVPISTRRVLTPGRRKRRRSKIINASSSSVRRSKLVKPRLRARMSNCISSKSG